MWSANEWAALGEILSGIGTFALAGAAVFGMNSWKEQRRTERKSQLAERILSATHEVYCKLNELRNPFLEASEYTTAQKILETKGLLNSTSEDNRKRITRQLYYTRFNAAQDSRLDLRACQPLTKALFGEGIVATMEQLDRQFMAVYAAIEAQYKFSERTEPAFRAEMEAILWSKYPTADANEMDQKIEDLVKEIEDICTPVLRLET